MALTMAQGMKRLAMPVAALFGVAVLATVLTSRLAAHDTVLGPVQAGGNPSAALTAFHEAFIVAAALTVLGIVASLLINDKEALPSMRQAPSPAEVQAAEEGVPAAMQ